MFSKSKWLEMSSLGIAQTKQLRGLGSPGHLFRARYFGDSADPSLRLGLEGDKHRKNCECCPVSQLIVR